MFIRLMFDEKCRAKVEARGELMEHKASIYEGVCFLEVSGRATPEGYSETIKDVVSLSEWEPGMDILVDYSQLELSHVSADGLERLAQALAGSRQELGDGLFAIVTPKVMEYGMGRMWEIYMRRYTDVTVAVFYTLDAAKHWIESEQV